MSTSRHGVWFSGLLATGVLKTRHTQLLESIGASSSKTYTELVTDGIGTLLRAAVARINSGDRHAKVDVRRRNRLT